MIKQNIKIAILAIFIFLGIWAIVCAFIKIDVCCDAIINFSQETPILSINKKESAYIEKYEIDKVKVKYENQYYSCSITFESQIDETTNYMVFLPSIIPRSQPYLFSNIIFDTLNVYEFLIKK